MIACPKIRTIKEAAVISMVPYFIFEVVTITNGNMVRNEFLQASFCQ